MLTTTGAASSGMHLADGAQPITPSSDAQRAAAAALADSPAVQAPVSPQGNFVRQLLADLKQQGDMPPAGKAAPQSKRPVPDMNLTSFVA